MPQRRMFFILVLGLVGSLAGALVGGVPDTLPRAALGSKILLYTARTAGLFITYVLLVVILARAWRGDLPEEVHGLRWRSK